MQAPQVGDVWEYQNYSCTTRQYVTRVTKDRVFYQYRPHGQKAAEFDFAIGLFQFGATLIERNGKQVH